MLAVTGKRKVKPIFRKSSSAEHLLLLPVDVPLQRVLSTKQPLTSDSSGDDWSSHFTIQTKDAFWLPLHYIILYLCSHPSASHRTKSLHLSQILNGLNRTECGGPHTKARRGKHCRTPRLCLSVCLPRVCPRGGDKSCHQPLSLSVAARKQLFVSFQPLGKRLFRLLRVKNNSNLKGKKKKKRYSGLFKRGKHEG